MHPSNLVALVSLTAGSVLLAQQPASEPTPIQPAPQTHPDQRRLPLSSLAGTVTDTSGAVLPSATVLLRGADGQLQRSARSDSSGAFALSGLPSGDYRLIVSVPGFQPSELPVALGSSAVVLHLVLAVSAVNTSVEVRGREDDLTGIADSATEGSVGAAELQARPLLRSGEVLETVPGLLVTQHAGGGKANQYFLRGFNLDHGTDLAISIEGMPLNLPSHAHGEGYADMNTVIPEFVEQLDFRKGPYYAEVGNYGSAGAVRLEFFRTLPHNFIQVEGGTFGFGRAVFGASRKLGRGHLLGGGEVFHDDGPWSHPDNFYKFNGIATYSQGSPAQGFSVTARAYNGSWNSSDQIAKPALPSVGLYGTLNPTDGGHSGRHSLQGEWHRQGASSSTAISAYGFFYTLNLFSDFTYFLTDRNRGDQFNQRDRRWVAGLDARHTLSGELFGRRMENTFGLQVRNDWIHNGLFQSERRIRVSKTDAATGNALPAVTEADRLTDTQIGFYAESRIEWTGKLRSVLGIRGDLQHFGVTSLVTSSNSGASSKALPSPKLSLVFGPWRRTEFYTQAGFSFHSNDGRGTTQTVEPVSGENPYPNTASTPIPPLIPTKGGEFGMRTTAVPHLQSTLSIWYLHSTSELQQSGDTGGTTASNQPSERYGFEWANFVSPLEHVAFDLDLASSRALFTETDADDAAPGSGGGKRVPEVVGTVLSSGVTLHDLRGFTSSLRLRYFGPRDLTSDGLFRSAATALVNAGIAYRFGTRWSLSADLLNVLDRKDHDIDYAYLSRITPAAAPAFTDVFHPVEPFQVRFALRRSLSGSF